MNERVAGADLVPALMGLMAATGGRVFLLGGENGTAGVAAARLLERHPGLVVAGVYEPPRMALEQLDSAGIIARIRDAQPEVLLVAFSRSPLGKAGQEAALATLPRTREIWATRLQLVKKGGNR